MANANRRRVIAFVTSNVNKVKEIQAMLEQHLLNSKFNICAETSSAAKQVYEIQDEDPVKITRHKLISVAQVCKYVRCFRPSVLKLPQDPLFPLVFLKRLT